MMQVRRLVGVVQVVNRFHNSAVSDATLEVSYIAPFCHRRGIAAALAASAVRGSLREPNVAHAHRRRQQERISLGITEFQFRMLPGNPPLMRGQHEQRVCDHIPCEYARVVSRPE